MNRQQLILLIAFSLTSLVLSVFDVLTIVLFSYLLTSESSNLPVVDLIFPMFEMGYWAKILCILVVCRFCIFICATMLHSKLIYNCQILLKKQLFASISHNNRIRLMKSDGEITKDLVIETGNFINNVVFYSLQLLSDVIPLFAIMILLLNTNLYASLAIIAYLVMITLVFQSVTRKRLSEHGRERELKEGALLTFLGGYLKNISILRLNKNNSIFNVRFNNFVIDIANAHFWQQFYYALPRITLESSIFLMLALIIVVSGNIALTYLIPLGLGAMRLLPILGRMNFTYQAFQFGKPSYLKVIEYFRFENLSMFERPLEYILGDQSLKISAQKLIYVNETRSVDIPMIEIKLGEVTLISGNSGVGKSTLLHALSECRFADQARERKIAFVQQTSEFFDGVVLDNVTMFDENVDLNKVAKIFNILEIDEFLSLEASQKLSITNRSKFSGGQLQRLALARALYIRPEILLLDEATSALNYKLDIQILKNVKEYINGTIIFCSHTVYEEVFWDSKVKL